jgi:hypothetical protein
VLWGAGLEDACKELTLRECSDVGRFLPGLCGALQALVTGRELTDDEEIAHELLEQARNEDLMELEKTGRIQWARYDYLRSLS